MPSNLVVRTYAPARRILVTVVYIVLGVLSLYMAYEYGRQEAGFDGIEAVKKRAELNRQIGALRDENRQLRVQLAAIGLHRKGSTSRPRDARSTRARPRRSTRLRLRPAWPNARSSA